ncbi:MAG: hypothetical protein U0Z44_19960 [Kouleothrix sp.]
MRGTDALAGQGSGGYAPGTLWAGPAYAVYSLTAAAQSLFPKEYDARNLLLHEIASRKARLATAAVLQSAHGWPASTAGRWRA